MRDQLFIAYSRKDVKWLDRLMVFLHPLLRNTQVDLWLDRGTVTDNRRLIEELKLSLASAKVCLLLVSADFLASDLMSILPKQLGAASRKGMIVTWIPVRPSLVEATDVYKYPAAISPSRPLTTLTPARRDGVLAQIAESIASLLLRPPAAKSKKPASKTARAAGKSPAKSAAKSAAVEPDAKRTFVCYAREDESFALDLASDLKDEGVNVWVDQWDIPSGADWDYEIDRALYDCFYFLIVLSPSAVESEEVRSELRIALDERKRIAPVLYQPCRVPRRLRLIQHIDCTEAAGGRTERAMRLILRALGR